MYLQRLQNLVVILLLFAALAACAPAAEQVVEEPSPVPATATAVGEAPVPTMTPELADEPTPTAEPAATVAVADYLTLVQALSLAGIPAGPVDEATVSFLDIPGEVIEAGDEQAWAFLFEDEGAREAAVAFLLETPPALGEEFAPLGEAPGVWAAGPMLILAPSAGAVAEVLNEVVGPAVPVTFAEPAAAADCSVVGRPAAVVQDNMSGTYHLVDPLSGASCTFTGLEFPLGDIQATAEALYYIEVIFGGDSAAATAYRLVPGAEREALPFVEFEFPGFLQPAMAVSGEGSLIAWTRVTEGETDFNNNIWVAGADGGDARAVLADYLTPKGDMQAAEGLPRLVKPLRFSTDNSQLFFTLQPYGLGGVWTAFSGRYDNLYVVPLSGGEPELLFDCASVDLFLCIGDFDNSGQNVLYADSNEKRVVAVAPPAETIGTVELEADYVGYPTFAPDGAVGFYSADLGEVDDQGSDLFAAPGRIHWLAPINAGAADVWAGADGLLPVPRWLDADHLITGLSTEDAWGMALVGRDGSVTQLEPWPSQLITVMPAE